MSMRTPCTSVPGEKGLRMPNKEFRALGALGVFRVWGLGLQGLEFYSFRKQGFGVLGLRVVVFFGAQG